MSRKLALRQLGAQPCFVALRERAFELCARDLALRTQVVAPQLDEQFALLNALAFANAKPIDDASGRRREPRSPMRFDRSCARVGNDLLDCTAIDCAHDDANDLRPRPTRVAVGQQRERRRDRSPLRSGLHDTTGPLAQRLEHAPMRGLLRALSAGELPTRYEASRNVPENDFPSRYLPAPGVTAPSTLGSTSPVSTTTLPKMRTNSATGTENRPAFVG